MSSKAFDRAAYRPMPVARTARAQLPLPGVGNYQSSSSRAAPELAGHNFASISIASHGVAAESAVLRRQPAQGEQLPPPAAAAARPVAPPPASLFQTEQVGGVTVELQAGDSLRTVADRIYGRHDARFIELLRRANDLTPADDRRLRPGRRIVVPAIRRPVGRAVTAAQAVPADQQFRVPVGQETFAAEGIEAPGDPLHSRQPHVPAAAGSGLTLGRGYDMGQRSAAQVERDLIQAGIDATAARQYAAGAGRLGAAARRFRDAHPELVELTPAQQWNLFVQEYQRQANTTQDNITLQELGRPEHERLDPATLDDATSQLLVDLNFRGDLTPQRWNRLRVHVNDRAALGEFVRHRANWPGVPQDRYERRCRMIGVEPEPQNAQAPPANAPAAGVPLRRLAADNESHSSQGQVRACSQGSQLAPAIVTDALAATPQSLEPGLRTAMEARLGHSFGHVKVHADSLADQSARAVDALAYNVGEHIVFRRGAYRPDTEHGRNLVLHELVHVAQQPTAAPTDTRRDIVLGDPSSDQEREAQHVVARQRARLFNVRSCSGIALPQVQRQAAAAASSSTASETAAEQQPVAFEQIRNEATAIVRGKTLEDIEKLVGGRQYEQSGRVDWVGVAQLLLPEFRSVLAADFSGFDFIPEEGVPAADFAKNHERVIEVMKQKLAGSTQKIVDQMIAAELAKPEPQAAAAEAGAHGPAQRTKEEIAAAVKSSIESDPALKDSIASQAREAAAQELAAKSAAPLCFFISAYLYYRAVDRISADVTFASWYKTQLRMGHVGATRSGGLAFGAARGSRYEQGKLREYAALSDVPQNVRLAISSQRYRQYTDKQGVVQYSTHYLLVVRGSDGVWRNLDHTSAAPEWHGGKTDVGRLIKVWCDPEVLAMAAGAPPQTAAPSSPAPAASAEAAAQDRLLQCVDAWNELENQQSIPELQPGPGNP